MNKNFLNKFKLNLEKKPANPQIELKMLPRLKAVGFTFFFFSCVSFFYALWAPREKAETEIASTELYSGISLITDETPFELNPTEVLNFYVVSAIFAIGGGLILFTVYKKRKRYTDS